MSRTDEWAGFRPPTSSPRIVKSTLANVTSGDIPAQ
jgi:hypothetical protein